VEYELHVEVLPNERLLDASAQTAQTESHHRYPQLGAGGEVAPRRVERDANLKPLTHGAFDLTMAKRARRLEENSWREA
jgi:hypothetical protein